MHPLNRNLVVISLVCALYFIGMFYVWHIVSEADRACKNLHTPTPLAECTIEPDGPKNFVFIKDFEPLGAPVSYSNRKSDLRSYLPVRATTLDGEGEPHENVFVLHCNSNNLDIEAIATADSLKGTLRQPTSKKRDLNNCELAIQAQYPDLDLRNAAKIWLYTPTPSYFYYILYGIFFGYSFLGLAYLTWLFHRAWKKEREWLKRTGEFQRSDIMKYPKAVRLVHGDPSLSPSSLAPRSIDPTYDVPAKPNKKHPKSRVFAWRILSFVVSIVIVCAVQFTFIYYDVQWNTGMVSAAVFMAVLSMMQTFLQSKIISIDKSRQETPIKEKKARYRLTAFHQYHDKVLRELGFLDIGDYQLVCTNVAMRYRTIYLSPQGNTLVELGEQGLRQFFTIETLTNDGKFLETNSLVPKTLEMLDPNVRHLCHGADEKDFLKALEEHDDFVAERTYGGSVLEAQFTEERFGRFLAWPSEKV